MAFQPVPNGISAVVRGTLADGHEWQNSYWFSTTGDLFQSDADALAGILGPAYDDIKSYWYTGTVAVDVLVTDRRTEGAPQFVSTNTFPVTGTDSAQPLPAQTSALVSWNTGFRGKAGRGRTYIPGFTEAGSAGDSPVAGLTTALGNFADDIVAAPFNVASLYKGSTVATTGRLRKKPTPRPSGFLFEITGYKIAPAWATQRRRAIRV